MMTPLKIWISRRSELPDWSKTFCWLWNSNLSKLLATEIKLPEKLEKHTSWNWKRLQQMKKRRVDLSLLSWNTYTTFCILVFPKLRCASTIRIFKAQMDSMRAIATFPTFSVVPSPITGEFRTLKGLTATYYGRTLVWSLVAKSFKMLSRPVGFLLYGEMGVGFSPLLENFIREKKWAAANHIGTYFLDEKRRPQT